MIDLINKRSEMNHAPFSFSKLNTHKHCNRRFKYQYVLKLPQENTDKTALFKGSAVHSMLENYPEPSSYKLAPKYQHIVDAFVKTEIGVKYLTKPSTRELKIAFDENIEPCSYSGKDCVFRGSVDIISVQNNVLNICDYKTGKLKDLKYQSFDQLMFYAIYFFAVYPKINEIRVSYIYVEHDTENDLTLFREYFESYKSQLFNLIKNVETDVQFNKNVSKLCDWCPFQTTCVSE